MDNNQNVNKNYKANIHDSLYYLLIYTTFI